MKAFELPGDFALPDVGPAWDHLVRDVDPRFGLHAFSACTMMSLRKSLRNGRVWIDHSLSFRSREQMLISPAEWARWRLMAACGEPTSAWSSSRAGYRWPASISAL